MSTSQRIHATQIKFHCEITIMSSSMRNAIQRRNHKERVQPASREKWGLLEKSKDYKLRAADHKAKRLRLKVLREKAVNRNPDEFSFGMLSSKTSKQGGGRAGDRGNKSLGHDAVLLLKGQDAGYLRLMLDKTKRQRQRVEGEVTESNGGAGKVRVFVNGVEEQRKFLGEQDNELDEDEESRASENSVDWEDEAEAEEAQDTKVSLDYKQRLLKALLKRENELASAERELNLQRAKMTNTIGGMNKNGVKYKIRDRKR
jgi:U3 small nucleolar RNA-associated protein 11